jgi:hypothetical protein
MPAPRSFNEILAEGLNRNIKAGEALRRVHSERPFTDREEIRAAFYREMACLQAGEFTDDDRDELHQMGVALDEPKSNLLIFPSTTLPNEDQKS